MMMIPHRVPPALPFRFASAVIVFDQTGECQASCRMACVMSFVYATPLFRVFDWLWTKAAWITASRSGLSVTAVIGVQFRV